MLGQIIYNVEDYSGTGGIISTAMNGKNYTDEQFNNNKSDGYEKINIFEPNFLSKVNGGIKNITKIGIQAPPGTKFVFNTYDGENEIETPYIMIGQSGIYELDDNVNMDGLTFIRPKGYALDIKKSEQLIHDGKGIMNEAKETFDLKYNNILNLYGSAQNSNSNEKFWQEYAIIHKEYITNYNLGHSMYVQGQSGVYIQSDLERDIRNVIIDFVYSTQTQEVN